VSRLPQVSVITRLRLDACLYDPAPPPVPGKKGRPALKGQRQPKLAERLADPHTPWQKCRLSWYAGGTREMEIATGTALWYQSPVPPLAIRWVLIRDPQGQYEPLALLCADQQAEAVQIVEWFVGATGPSKSPFMKFVRIWASRRSANGRIWRSCAPLPPMPGSLFVRHSVCETTVG
jgi:hypothetical protein